MQPANAPTNALQVMTIAPTDAPTDAPTTDANAPHTRPPIPPSAPALSRAATSTARAARIRHGCAIAPLASKRSDQCKDSQDHGKGKGGKDLIVGMRMLTFKPELSRDRRQTARQPCSAGQAFVRSDRPRSHGRRRQRSRARL